MRKRSLLALILASTSLWACKAKPQEPAATEPGQAVHAAEPPKSAEAETPGNEMTEQEEQVIVKDFVTRFTNAIDADDATGWPDVITPERAVRYAQEGILDKVYAAWHRGTATVSDKIRRAPFRLEKTPEKMTLHFENVIVANDPETGYSMTVRIEDGKMYLDEN